MRIAASLVHLASGGFFLSVLWLAAAIISVVIPATRPMARSCLQLAAFHLYPFGRELVHDTELQNFGVFLRTGRVQQWGKTYPLTPAMIAKGVLWSPAALVLVSAHALHGILASVITLSNPWRTQSFFMLGPAFFPLGWRVVPASPARARFAHPRRRLPLQYVPRRGRSRFQDRPRLIRSVGLTAGSAVLALWASYSATGPLIPSAAPPGGYRGPADYVGQATQNPMPSMLYRIRLDASPPVPLGFPRVKLAEAGRGCATELRAEIEIRLARRHTEYPLPLGAAQIPARPGLFGPGGALERIGNAQALAASRATSKAAEAPCAKDVAADASRAAALAYRKAEAERLARKAAPDTILASLGPSPMIGEARQRHRLQIRNLQNISRMAALVSPAKSPDQTHADDPAARVARTRWLKVPLSAGEDADGALGT